MSRMESRGRKKATSGGRYPVRATARAATGAVIWVLPHYDIVNDIVMIVTSTIFYYDILITIFFYDIVERYRKSS